MRMRMTRFKLSKMSENGIIMGLRIVLGFSHGAMNLKGF